MMYLLTCRPTVAFLLLMVCVAAWGATPPKQQGAVTNRDEKAPALPSFPLHFEPNRGHAGADVQFLSRGAGYSVYLSAREAALVFPRVSLESGVERTTPLKSLAGSFRPAGLNRTPVPEGLLEPVVVRMSFVGANPAPKIEGQDALAGRSNYLLGSDPSAWRTNVLHYAGVVYEEIYPGIALVFYGHEGRLEHDFIVSPAADPSTIQVLYDGVERLEVDEAGDLILVTKAGWLRQKKPRVYQDIDGKRQFVRGGYVLRAENEIKFDVANYNPDVPLVIDPVLWDFQFGGSGAERIFGIGVDAAGNTYYSGFTSSTDFPVGGAAIPKAAYGGGVFDGFVAKLAADASQFLYTTYLGGSFGDSATALAVDRAGNAYVTGFTQSPNFPTTPGAHQTILGGSGDAFVSKLDPNGALVYSTFIGGSGFEDSQQVIIDSNGLACITGVTNSTDLQTTPDAFQTTPQGEADAYVAILSATGGQLRYASYVGGSENDVGLGIAMGAAANLYVTGWTASPDFPVSPDSFQPLNRGAADAFLVSLTPDRRQLEYGTYLGGTGDDIPWAGVVVDRSEAVSIAGATTSTDFPTAGPVATSYQGGDSDGFFAQFAFPRRDSVENKSGPPALIYKGLPQGGSGDDEPLPPPNLTVSQVLGTDASDQVFGLDFGSYGAYYPFGDSTGIDDPGVGCVAGELCAGIWPLGPGWPSNEFLARWRGSGAELHHLGGINFYSGNTFVGENEQGRALTETVQDQHYSPATSLTNADSGLPSLIFEPVSPATGEIYDLLRAFSLGGTVSVRLILYHASLLQLNEIASALGDNWMHNFDLTLTRDDGRATVQLFGGKTVRFKQGDGGWGLDTFERLNYQLVSEAGGFRFMDPRENLIYSFDVMGRLTHIENRNGDALEVTQGPAGPIAVSDGRGRRLTFSYDGDRLVRVEDQTGRFVAFGHTGDQLTAYTDANGNTETYEYTEAGGRDGLLLRRTLPRGNTPITQTYDAEARVVRQSDSRGNEYRASYNTPAAGVTRETDPEGATRIHQHGGFNFLTALTDAIGNTTTLEYDLRGNRTGIVDRRGNRTSLGYDADGNPSFVTDAEGNTTTFAYSRQVQGPFTFHDLTGIGFPDDTSLEMAYDGAGNLIAFTDRAGRDWESTYNERGQILTFRRPTGAVTSFSYNADGTRASVRLPSGETTTYEYDPQKRLAQVNNPDGTSRGYTYDNLDRLLTGVNERGRTLTFTYDPNGRLASFSDPLGQTTDIGYDGDDRVIDFTDPLGNTYRRDYDRVGRLNRTTNPAGETVTADRDPEGRATSLADPAGAFLRMSYDPEGSISSLTDGLGNTWQFLSTALGELAEIIDPLGRNHRFTYDSMQRLTSYVNPMSQTTEVSYNERGLTERITLPGGIAASFIHNALGRLTNVTDPNGNIWRRTYDAQGRLTSFVDPLDRAVAVQYDNRQRPSRVETPEGSLDLTYDETGNVLRPPVLRRHRPAARGR